MLGACSSDPGVILSSPITKRVKKIQRSRANDDADGEADDESPVETVLESRKAVSRRKAGRDRKRTMAERQAKRDAERVAAGQAAVAANEEMIARAVREVEDARVACFTAVLATLKAGNQTWGDFVEWISQPASQKAQERFDGLFKRRPQDPSASKGQTQVGRILDLWVTRNSNTGKADVHDWAMRYACRVVNREANSVSRKGVLLTRPEMVTGSYLHSFELSSIHERIRALCPSTTELLRQLTTTRRQRKQAESPPVTSQEKENVQKREEKKLTRIGSALTILLGERSQRNSLVKNVLGLYLYATGSQRQAITILSSFGISSSYPSIAGKGKKPKPEPRGWETSERDETEDSDNEDEDPDWTPSAAASTSGSSTDGDTVYTSEEEIVGEEASNKQGDQPPDAIEDTIEDDEVSALSASAGPQEAPNVVVAILARGVGLLRRLSESCRASTRTCAQCNICGHVYDNINMVFKVAEQILGRKDSQENGTCATVFPLHDAKPESLQTSDLLSSIDKAPPLSVSDICHSKDEAALFHQSLEHALLLTIVNACDVFARFRPQLDTSLPATDDKMPLRRTEVHPLPAMNIDESSTTGNSEVMDAIFKELGYPVGTAKFSGITHLTFGDQLSISRLRTLIANRAGHEMLSDSYANIVFGPGFFHHQMAVVHGIIETHWGDPSAGFHNPACLSFFNTVLDRKPIVLSSLPPYRVCRDLIFTSLSAAALHCLRLTTGCDTLEDYAVGLTFDKLKMDVSEVFKKYIDPAAVQSLRRARDDEIDRRTREANPAGTQPTDPPFDPLAVPLNVGDMVFENVSLFLRDALILREFTDAIKGGYSGRIIRTLKILALMYRGSGRTKYAHELLHLVHNLTHVWPQGLRQVMINNWLVNPTGKPDAWVPVDLLQEHMNFWTKVIYKANGSNASWEWLQMVSPCIDVLRKLALQMNATLGARLGTKHKSPTLDKDLIALQNSLQEHNVFQLEPGRVLRDMKTPVVPNVVTLGLNQLHGPLQDYNRTFAQLQQRRREDPLTDETSPPSSPEVASLVTDASSEEQVIPMLDSFNAEAASMVVTGFGAGAMSIQEGSMGHPSTGLAQGTHEEEEEEAEEEEDDDDVYWRAVDEDYNPNWVFAEEEEPSLDLGDYF
ncbi:hypothetical protein GSI_12667 [Ganoderma sinense ZZ0214-1]|uniref:DUF6589 domain-containing protein n=1 Tax=Ganoderma sinense ZZ0214-1 TaxID=1077348 RepID=A0A2G8RTE0_9APHY|nr:hypothetical protein GSI_12667 [Ganoderma sinense ZZ0214-1]